MSAVEMEVRSAGDRNWGMQPRAWWSRLKGDSAKKRPGDRATLARLRRCHTPLDAFFVPATLRLLPPSAHGAGSGNPGLDIYGAIAIVLAHVREDVPDRLVARMVGRERLDAPETALVSEVRFRHLLQVDNATELMTGMRRLVRQLGGKANVDDLARSMLWWLRGESRRRRWAFDYYGAGVADPGSAIADQS